MPKPKQTRLLLQIGKGKMHYLWRVMSYIEYLNHSHANRIGQDLAMIEIRSESDYGPDPLSDIHSIFFVFSGAITLEMEGEQRSYGAGYVINIIPFHSFRIISVTSDIHTFQLLYTDTYAKDVFQSGPPFPMEYMGRLMIEPALSLAPEQMQLFKKHFTGLKAILDEKQHFYFREKVKCGVRMLLMDLGDITHRMFESRSIDEESDTKKILLLRFLSMLEKSVCNHRTVGYYASELCVSAQYLERVVKALSKHSVKQWIQQALIGQVNKRLLGTNDPIQQIANDFGFIDQPTFTKYYRRSMETTPTEYRKNNIS